MGDCIPILGIVCLAHAGGYLQKVFQGTKALLTKFQHQEFLRKALMEKSSSDQLQLTWKGLYQALLSMPNPVRLGGNFYLLSLLG